MENRHFRIFIIYFCFLICSGLAAQPRAAAGLLDLRELNLADDVAALDGEWDFFWGNFLVPGSNPEEKGIHVTFPGAWEGIARSEGAFPAKGYATYRLRILFSQDQKTAAFHMPIMGTSYRFYFDQDLIASNGEPGRDEAHSRPDFLPMVTSAVAIPAGGEAIVTLHIANFHDRSGGPWQSIHVGSQSSIRRMRENLLAVDLFLCGALLIIGLYHLGLFVFRTKDRLPLFFGLFCLVMAVRSLGEGEKYLLNLFPGLSWTAAVRISYLTFFVPIPLFLAYFTYLFYRESSRLLLYLTAALSAVLSFIVLLTPVKIFSEALPVGHVTAVILGLYCAVVNVRALFHRRIEAPIFMIGLLIFAFTVVNDIALSYTVFGTRVLAPFGVFVFIFAQAYLLSTRFSRAFIATEQLSMNLDTLNSELEQRIEDRNRELNRTLQSIRVDLSTARKIQLGSLPGTDGHPGFSIASLYMPMQEVGGDMFAIAQTSGRRLRCCLADATGHGVQAALITMALKSEFENLSPLHENPADLLKALNAGFCEKFKSLNVFCSAIIADIDPVSLEVVYASAGHPDQWILNGNTGNPLMKTGPIIGMSIASKFTNGRVPFRHGQMLLLFSDGLFEQLRKEGADFGEEDLKNFLTSHNSSEPRDSMKLLSQAVDASLDGQERKDDITALAIGYDRNE